MKFDKPKPGHVLVVFDVEVRGSVQVQMPFDEYDRLKEEGAHSHDPDSVGIDLVDFLDAADHQEATVEDWIDPREKPKKKVAR